MDRGRGRGDVRRRRMPVPQWPHERKADEQDQDNAYPRRAPELLIANRRRFHRRPPRYLPSYHH